MSKLLASVLALSAIVVAVGVYPNSRTLDTSFDQATTWLYDRWTKTQQISLQDIKECTCEVRSAQWISTQKLEVFYELSC